MALESAGLLGFCHMDTYRQTSRPATWRRLGDFNCSNFQGFLVDDYVYLTPDAAFEVARAQSRFRYRSH